MQSISFTAASMILQRYRIRLTLRMGGVDHATEPAVNTRPRKRHGFKTPEEVLYG